jgi:hypothetical protein
LVEVKLFNTTRIRVRVVCGTDQLTQLLNYRYSRSLTNETCNSRVSTR